MLDVIFPGLLYMKLDKMCKKMPIIATHETPYNTNRHTPQTATPKPLYPSKSK